MAEPMPTETRSVTRHLFPRGRGRKRLTLLWLGFAAATVATAVAVYRLYETVRRELHEQSEVALAQQRTKALERVQSVTDALRHATIAKLAGFHVEGLAHALRQWDESDASVIGVFQWEADKGFLPGSAITPGGALEPEEIAALWQEFRAQPTSRGTAETGSPKHVGAFRTSVVRTLNNPSFPPRELGYQGENLEMLAYGGRAADPCAGWAVKAGTSSASWIFWYQLGAGAAVRGCLVDVAPLVAKLRGEFADSRLARISLVAEREVKSSADAHAKTTLEELLPGYALVALPGDVFEEKQSGARLTALAVGLLLGVFLLGTAFLANLSRREVRDAERKTTFVTQVSHELRTPITSIRMFADMLAAPDLSEAKRTKFAGTISRESQRLGTLIERLLTFSALEKGKHAVTIGTVDVSAIVRETLDEMDATLQAVSLRPELEIPASPVFAAADSSTVKQALLNVIDNAIKYARDGKILRVTLASDAAAVRLRIADGGPGIPRALREQVFEPFVQGGQTLTDKAPGVGLGLSIARGLLRNAGGDLVLLPSTTGAVFEIRLPAASPA